ncbi:hypothetical protein [Roseivirga sp. E12]|uniref:hypothetical protein n=1 Tax=Roseivirga sp. E12 TaxID=2819237 RepID=UPI001ABCDABC|nr:hypothetical protein [Roseivirga sp. E12]MBO3700096.1 hypothetical protein [Roseivirga sp. E12]
MKNIIYVKKLSLTVVATLIILISNVTQGQTGNQSCEAGGEMWVCGRNQILQAHSDWNSNCDGPVICGAVLRTIIDVCSPDETTSEILGGGPGCFNRI